MRSWFACAIVGLVSSAIGSAALADQDFPQREITFIVPWNAGGSNDVLARGLQPLLRERGINIVIENITGATGANGLRRVAGAAPDGYTLGMGTSLTLAVMVQKKVPLKNDQFTNIARVSTEPLMLLVPTSSPYQSLDQFIEHMKKTPGGVTIGTPGSYNLNHIFASMTARAAGVAYTNVPYTGGSQVVADLLGQHVEVGVLKPSETIGVIQQGSLKPIGVFADERLEMLPDVPTFKEKGFDVFPYGPVAQMAYVVGPANLPPDIRARLIHAFRTAIQDPRFKEFAQKNVFLVDDMTGDALNKEIGDVSASIDAVATKVFPRTE
jgi:tripartite-type tricarboxylate transporter receptor subunit TctC